jgi:cytoskeletal protein CcmA (bactofilin family)
MTNPLRPEGKTSPRSSAPLPPEPAKPLPPLVPPGGRFEGLVSFRGEARLDGEVVGEVRAEGRLQIGPSARVEGNIEIDEAVIAGNVVGDVRARSRVELQETARVRGNIQTPRLEMAEGGVLEGRCLTGAAAQSCAEGLSDSDSLP